MLKIREIKVSLGAGGHDTVDGLQVDLLGDVPEHGISIRFHSAITFYILLVLSGDGAPLYFLLTEYISLNINLYIC